MGQSHIPSLDVPATAKAALQRFASHPNPKLYRLRPPATEDALAAREAKLGHRLPPELREALLLHDGIRETFVHTKDYLGGTKTLSKLRTDFRSQWADLLEDNDEPPLRFGRRYLVLGAIHGTGHHFVLLDRLRLLNGVHPVVTIDLDDGEEVQGFRSLAHYLHYLLLDLHDLGAAKLGKLFPEYYSSKVFKRMMREAQKVEES